MRVCFQRSQVTEATAAGEYVNRHFDNGRSEFIEDADLGEQFEIFRAVVIELAAE